MRWTFLNNHGKALLCLARDPGVRLRDIAGSERTIGELLDLLSGADDRRSS